MDGHTFVFLEAQHVGRVGWIFFTVGLLHVQAASDCLLLGAGGNHFEHLEQ